MGVCVGGGGGGRRMRACFVVTKNITQVRFKCTFIGLSSGPFELSFHLWRFFRYNNLLISHHRHHFT